MKTIVMLALCLPFSFALSQEEVVQAPPTFHNPSEINKTMSPPIDVVVPYHQAVEPAKEPVKESVKVEQINNVYSQIKDSVLFLEINPVSLKYNYMDFLSDNLTNNVRDLDLDTSQLKFKMMPLNFKFGFDNASWGSFAEVEIEDESNASELVIYGKIGGHKLGGGLSFQVEENEANVTVAGVKGKAKTKETSVHPYFYMSFELSNSESLIVEQWTKIGGACQDSQSDDIRFKGLAFVFNPALEMYFKINPKLMIGSGLEFMYMRYAGDITVSGVKNTYGVTGNAFEMEFNIIKTKFLF